ncbi:hypothetical protein [Bifidobacterium sp. ESL0732]|uniref:hypothetical protein n=1 Tax=Bifidobacterium sp. ESL0732 TaxID=2983222 RepID=UPI0023F922A4|nr:hypothetical protein [Bifidobacterium sp. ESL0732]WEV63549.1 hypothetical protein OZX70_06210 [Bifidobacterium sp. ESL0732]
MTSGRVRKQWWRAVVCSLLAICFALVSLAIVPPSTSSPISSPVGVAQANEVSVQANEPIDYKPKLFKMLALNTHIDTDQDELRMDFVLRVARGQVRANDPTQCQTGFPSTGRSCGLKLLFQNDASATGGLTTLTYINTLGSGLAGAAGALKWAQNRDERYTIHSIVNSGVYDYLTISVEADLSYTNSVDRTAIGGVTTPQYVYAQTGNVNDNNWTIPPNRAEGSTWTNLTAAYPAKLYSRECSGTGAGADCNGPRAFVGWDDNPLLWSGNQANWGLMTDVGINVVSGTPISAGTAPPNSFFVYWYNPWYDSGVTNTCSRNTSFYFQWLGLSGGQKWVPVNDLTPTAQRVDGQTPRGTSPASGSTSNSAFNRITLDNHDIRARSGSNMAPAQNLDGTIDFKKAKDDQPELDGYFKLVTWPITTTASGSTANCVAPNMRDAYNPLDGQPNGVTAGMSQSEADALVAKGWDIDTAYYKYSLPVVTPPVITTPAEGSWLQTQHPTIEGTGIPGHVVRLYAEDPSKPIVGTAPDDPDTRGRYIGEATVGSDGRWSIADNDNTVTNGSVRYHAWQAETTSGYDLTSGFSNIRTLQFVPPPVVLPNLTEVPHTKTTANGLLPTGSKVKVHGTVNTPAAGMTLKVYATRVAAESNVGNSHPTSDKLLCTLTNLSAGQQNWTCEVEPSFFYGQHTKLDTYVFQAYLSDAAGTNETSSSIDRTVVTLDMTSPRLDDTAVSGGNLSGTINKTYHNFGADADPEGNVTVHVTWPDGSTATPVTTDASGHWSVAVPNGLSSGDIHIYAVDSQTNETAIIAVPLNLIPPAKALPFTGDHSNLPWIITGLILLLLTLGAGIYAYVSRRMASEDPSFADPTTGKAVDDP